MPPAPGAAGNSDAVVSGVTASFLTVSDFVASTLPLLSVERYSIVCVPSAETTIGAERPWLEVVRDRGELLA